MAQRTFNVVLLKSFDMTEGEVFSGLIMENPNMYYGFGEYYNTRDAIGWASAIDGAMAAYYQACEDRQKATGVECLPEKIVSVVMTEIL